MRTIRAGGLLAIVILFSLGTNAACAAALGGFASSLGLFTALAAVFVVKGWPGHLPPESLSSAGAALAAAGGVAWLWRSRLHLRPARVAPVPSARARRPVSRQPGPIELPGCLDRDVLLADLRSHFVRLQDAWDRADDVALESLATPEMLNELKQQLPLVAAGPGASRTEIVAVAVELLGFERLPQDWLLSAEFSGLMRESEQEGVVPFRELWLLTQPKDASGRWRLARHQALL